MNWNFRSNKERKWVEVIFKDIRDQIVLNIVIGLNYKNKQEKKILGEDILNY